MTGGCTKAPIRLLLADVPISGLKEIVEVPLFNFSCLDEDG
jgi:hypothetical protein